MNGTTFFDKLQEFGTRPAPFSHYTAAELWNDPHVSERMLAAYTVPLAEAGAIVTGVDFSMRSIAHARRFVFDADSPDFAIVASVNDQLTSG